MRLQNHLIQVLALAGFCSLFVLDCGATATSAEQDDATRIDFATKAQPLLQKYCYACHGDEKPKGDINLARFHSEASFFDDPDLLEAALYAAQDEYMPPEDAPAPSVAERQTLVRWLQQTALAIEDTPPNDPGVVVMPRLNHREYDLVIRDLTGVPLKMGQFLTPDSGAGEGFLNVGQAQNMTVGQFEAFLSTAKRLVNQARVTASTGIGWFQAPQPPALSPDELRRLLVNAWTDWHELQQTGQRESQEKDLKRKVGMILGAYLEAAWRYRYRDELEIPDASLADIASKYDVPLYWRALEKLWAVLNRDRDYPDAVEVAENIFMCQLIQRWQALPPPKNGSLTAARDACRALDRRHEEQTANARYGLLRPAFEIPPEDKAAQQQEWGETQDGVRKFRFDLTRHDGDRLYLIVTDGGDGNKGDYAVWQNGEVTLADGGTRTLHQAGAILQTTDGQQVTFASHPKDDELPPGSIGVLAPSQLVLVLPDKATGMTIEAILDPQHGGNASLQPAVFAEPLEDLHFQPRLRVIGTRKSERAKWLDGQKTEFGVILGGGGYSRIRDVNAFVGFPEQYVEYLNIPWPQQEPRRTGVLWAVSALDIREHADDAALADLRALEQRLVDVAQPRQQDLAGFLVKHELEGFPEGILPATSDLAGLPDDARTAAAELLQAARAERHAQDTAARDVLRKFASRAWRREIAERELDELQRFYLDQRVQGASFDAAVKVPMTAVLVSPYFLYRFVEAKETDEIHRLRDNELASRLSFALWGSLPDEMLRSLSAAGSLQDEATLVAQVRRMLDDKRSSALATEFAGQWLLFADFKESSAPDPERFPDFTPELKAAMHEEAVRFFDDLFKNDRSILNVLNADYTFANQTLAEHYGIDGVNGSQMRRINVPEDHRGGLLGMAWMLTKTSTPLRTSPVKRGAWVYETLLGIHLPEPPPNIPPISDDERNEEGSTIREQLAEHRKNPACFSCHNKIDPLGLPLENFDAVGRWRQTDLAGEPVDALGEYASDESIDGFSELKEQLLARQDEFLRGFCRKLLGYMLGRPVLISDKPLLDEMMTELRAADYRPRAAIETVVTSRQFRYRRDHPDTAPSKR